MLQLDSDDLLDNPAEAQSAFYEGPGVSGPGAWGGVMPVPVMCFAGWRAGAVTRSSVGGGGTLLPDPSTGPWPGDLGGGAPLVHSCSGALRQMPALAHYSQEKGVQGFCGPIFAQLLGGGLRGEGIN